MCQLESNLFYNAVITYTQAQQSAFNDMRQHTWMCSFVLTCLVVGCHEDEIMMMRRTDLKTEQLGVTCDERSIASRKNHR